MREEFKESFKRLSLNDKRNELNNEMKTSFHILQTIKNNMGMDVDNNVIISNYNLAEDDKMSESEMLDLLYFDFFTIQQNILDIANVLFKK